ncbi:MAG TPA: hypothetical protein PLD41_13160 [Casimicrobium huifangae]|jgi:hypothetical protein|nr:hypothetical protein [Casimicrobium huifangae]HQA34766.1 hypothetical protein [Casimicrobium huifangae]
MVNKKARSLGRWLAGWAVMTGAQSSQVIQRRFSNFDKSRFPVFCLARKLNLQIGDL